MPRINHHASASGLDEKFYLNMYKQHSLNLSISSYGVVEMVVYIPHTRKNY